jgi:hypothetical protein
MALPHKPFDTEQWAAITIERWEEKITKLRIGHNNLLINSFTQHIISDSNGNPAMVTFALNYYGRMVDMGVGTGVKIADVGAPWTKRRPKKWYSKTLSRELYRLAGFMARSYGRQANMILVENIRNITMDN